MACLRALIGACLLVLAGSRAVPGAVASKDLDGMKRRIESEKKGLSQLQIKEGGALKALGKIEEDLDRKSKYLKVTDDQYRAILGLIEKTETEARQVRGSMSQREALFRQRVTALYRWQRSSAPLRFAQGASVLGETLKRHRYFAATLAFDRGLIGEMHSETQRQESLRRQLSEQKDRLAEQKRLLGLARAAVAQEMDKKKILLISLRQEKDYRLKVLRDMAAAAQRLQKMLDEIARRTIVRPKDLPAPSFPGRGLDNLLGQLDWPVKGSVSAPFGKFKHPAFAAEVIRKGIDIDASAGDGVRAVEKGRVVFADRFTGYGRMVIIDHGERYYTIYGHLSEIIRKNGEELARGEILGRVGDSDSLSGAKLYFELRKDGRSVDPLPWFKKR
ncbi:MAG TPA: peptidoglycan DD-metalloendopeptidase family protein [Candidatus Limnocylindria bacterium]|nr:peptidoglycan DD-metalloendopeptidase family protein [Candidatus Limnocylindria bacterium]